MHENPIFEKHLQRTGYVVEQRNGQRIYWNPHSTFVTPVRGSEIYVGKLPRNLMEDCLVPLFERIGHVYLLRLMINHEGTSRGFCFVTYYRVDNAIAAVRALDGYEIRVGRNISVYLSVDNRRLFVNHIPFAITCEQLHEAFNMLVHGLKEVILPPSCYDAAFNRGYVFLEFHDHRCAAKARKLLRSKKRRLWDCEIAVDWSVPLSLPDITTSPKEITTLHCGYINYDITARLFEALIYQFLPAEIITSIRKRNNYAFISFINRACAEVGLAVLACSVMYGKKVNVNWFRLPQRWDEQVINHYCLSLPNRVRELMYNQKNSRNGPFPPEMFEKARAAKGNRTTDSMIPHISSPCVIEWSDSTDSDSFSDSF